MSRWYVITGGPSSGKTTMVNRLQQFGYRTTVEHARHYIDLQRVGGASVPEIRSRQLEFQRNVLTMQLAQEATLDPDETVFLDRALPDSLAYYRFLDLAPDPELLDALGRASYAKIFILDLLPLARDYARTEDPSAQRRIHELLVEVYGSLAAPIVHVPVLPPDDRVDFVLTHL